jgi:hypothetical protein
LIDNEERNEPRSKPIERLLKANRLMVFETVRRARLRILLNEVLCQGVYSLSMAAGVLILLLLLGTQILGWIWLAALPAVTLAGGMYLAWRRTPGSYQIAQRVDRALELADTLSTAVFFFNAPGRMAREMRHAQWMQAERVADGLDLRRAIPWRMPRAIYGTVLLVAIACSLAALRYGLRRQLDLRVPLARILVEKLGLPEVAKKARGSGQPPAPRKETPEPGFALDDKPQDGPAELDPATDAALDSAGVPDVDNSKTAPHRADGSKNGQPGEPEAGSDPNDEPEGVSANGGDQQADGRQGPGAGKQGRRTGDKEGSGNSGENSSLLGKFRDAMSSLLTRMRQGSGAQGNPQQAESQEGDPSKSQSANGRSDGKQGHQQGRGGQSDAQDGQSGEETQNAQNGQPSSAGENGQQAASKQPGSGIGSQDGSKDVKLAEQLAAMGKISEIIGKRSANVSGDVTVEVQSSNQQLRTPYAPRAAQHELAGGEISRDEVPVALQSYVQQYFEQVRKQAAAGTARK